MTAKCRVGPSEALGADKGIREKRTQGRPREVWAAADGQYWCRLLLSSDPPSWPGALAPSSRPLRPWAPEPESWPGSLRALGPCPPLPPRPPAPRASCGPHSLPCAQPSAGAPAAPSVSRCVLSSLEMLDSLSFWRDCFTPSENCTAFSLLYPSGNPSSGVWLPLPHLPFLTGCRRHPCVPCHSCVTAYLGCGHSFLFSWCLCPSMPVHGVCGQF